MIIPQHTQLFASGIIRFRLLCDHWQTNLRQCYCLPVSTEGQNVMDIYRTFKVTIIIIIIQSAQTVCGANPASYSMGNGTSLPWCKATEAWKRP